MGQDYLDVQYLVSDTDPALTGIRIQYDKKTININKVLHDNRIEDEYKNVGIYESKVEYK